MIPKYTIEYTVKRPKHGRSAQQSTDDPVACEEIIAELLDLGFAIRSIKHEGVALPPPKFDKVVRDAANLLASRKICESLGLKPEEERFRFGFAA